MKKEYDFSAAERGRFYKRGAMLNLPIYLDEDNRAFVECLAQRKKCDVSVVANKLIRANRTFLKTIK